ncbi:MULTISPECIES: flippase [unclassified Colwellia]|uniref:flippase n=1 Tax=unclassified Colwellia TaxID=196834 RepID=UPI0015F6A6CD|nr:MULTISPECIES: flippase [unclassified Colwellia]MBA6357989.1 flippase [Colwellia sp. BRX8-3]MBA6361836.1 flippase [Colwellia sp. BRX8-6]MBA6369677.1 flippase [Colwellia sp. BRX8-5]MBA6376986.1 flippase [Colwellia sp. BRX8-2]
MDIKIKLTNLKNNQGVMKYLKNTSWLLGEKILRMTLGLFVGIWIARYLGPEQFGLFSYAQSFVALFATFATLGLDGIVIRALVKDESHRDKLLGTTFILKLVGAILVLSLLAVAVFFQSNDHQTNLLIFIIASATIFQSFNTIDFYFQSRVLSKYVVYSNVSSLLLSSIIKVILILNEAPLIAFAYVILFDSLVLACGFIYFYFKNELQVFFWSFDKKMAKSLLKDSWPLILSGLVITMYMKIDQVMIKEMLDAGSVGQYAAAVRLSEVWYFIPVVIASSLFPAILNAKETSKTLYLSRCQKLYDLMAWLSIIIALPITFISDDVINLLYGSQYNSAIGVLKIHIWSAVFVFLGVASSKWFVAENLQKYYFYRTLAGAIINIFLNFILIPKYGIYGAAIATLIAQIIASYLYNAMNSKLRAVFWMQTKALLLPFRLFLKIYY